MEGTGLGSREQGTGQQGVGELKALRDGRKVREVQSKVPRVEKMEGLTLCKGRGQSVCWSELH